MKINAGTATFNLPEHVEPSTCRLVVFDKGDPRYNPGSYGRIIQLLSLPDLMEAHKRATKRNLSLRGTVSAYAVSIDLDALEFWPIPDADYYAELQYCPARKQI